MIPERADRPQWWAACRLGLAAGLFCLVHASSMAATHWALRAGSVRYLRHSGSVFDVEFSPDGRLLLTDCYAQRKVPGKREPADVFVFNLWDTRTGRLVRQLRPAIPSGSVQFTPDGKAIALFDGWTTIRFIDVKTGRTLRRLTRPSFDRFFAFSDDGRWLAVAGWVGTQYGDQAVFLYDTRTWTHMRTLTGFSVGGVRWFAFSPHSRLVAAIAVDREALTGELCVWDVKTGDSRFWLTDPDPMAVLDKGARVHYHGPLSFLPDGFTVVLGDEYLDLRGKPLRLRPVIPKRGRSCLARPPGRFRYALFYVDDELSRFELWDVKRGIRVREWTAPGINDPSAAFSPDGRILAIADREGGNTVRVIRMKPAGSARRRNPR